MLLTNKLILVTGASGGIGSEVCKLLAGQELGLILTCASQAKLLGLKAELHELYPDSHEGSVEIVAADISTEQGRNDIVAACEQAGGIDAVVNIAGILNFGLFQEQTPETINRLLQINTVAPLLLTRALLPQMLGKVQSRIVNVGSIFGSIGHPGFAVYCASKAAIKTFSEALSRELADTCVSVAYIAPRATRTALNNDRVQGLNAALGTKEDSPALVAAQICALLASDRKQQFLGWPEKLFVLVNAVLPSIVQNALVGKLPIIKKFARQI